MCCVSVHKAACKKLASCLFRTPDYYNNEIIMALMVQMYSKVNEDNGTHGKTLVQDAWDFKRKALLDFNFAR